MELKNKLIKEELSFHTLKIVKIPDPILRKKCRDIELSGGKVPEEIKKLSEDMIATMRSAFGCGIAGPQVGKDLNIFIAKVGLAGLYGTEVFINPKILSQGPLNHKSTEGCLSIPGRRGTVMRSTKINVEYINISGEKKIKEFSGFPAIVFQHEFDHLQGVLYIDKLI